MLARLSISPRFFQPSRPQPWTSRIAVSSMTTPTPAAQPWYAAYPLAKSTPERMSREAFLAELNDGAVAGKDFLLVDLRRNDHEVGICIITAGGKADRNYHQGATIRGSINLPAQSLHASIPTLYQLVRSASIHRVFWYCGKTLLVHHRKVAALIGSSSSVFSWSRYPRRRLVCGLHQRARRHADKERSPGWRSRRMDPGRRNLHKPHV